MSAASERDWLTETICRETHHFHPEGGCLLSRDAANAILAAGYTRQSRAEIQAEDPERWRCAMCGYPNADGYQDWARCPICGSEDFEEAPNGNKVANEPSPKAQEVLIEGSWFKREDLPAILGNYMRSCDQLGREVKELNMTLTELRPVARDVELQADALRAFRNRANDAGILGDPLYWFPIRDAAEAEMNRLLDRAQRIREGGDRG